jgi:lipoprotein signal peptidase
MSYRRTGTARSTAVVWLSVVAFIVFAVDVTSKRWALANLNAGDRRFGETLRLTLIHNHGFAWGLTAGSLTPILSALVTTILVALMLRVCRELAAVDRLAPLMLGLLAGAGLANAADGFFGEPGVVDFIALPVGGQEAVLNVADVAAALGLLLCIRSVFVLSRAIAVEKRQPAIAGMADAPRVRIEWERHVPLFDERLPRRQSDEIDRPRDDVTRLPRTDGGASDVPRAD